jgi:hypothetical protein
VGRCGFSAARAQEVLYGIDLTGLGWFWLLIGLVVRPERTMVRDGDEALPLILPGTALQLVLAGVGFTLVRTRMAPRPDRDH